MPPHKHEFLELVIILGGEGIHNFNGHRYRVRSGNVLFIDDESTHGYEDPYRLSLINILINKQALKKMENDLARLPGYLDFFKNPNTAKYPELVLSDEDLDQIVAWLDHIETEMVDLDSTAGHVLAESFLVLFFSLALKRTQRASPPRSPGDGLKSLLLWIDTHLHEPITVEQLALRAGFSERSFFRYFKEKMGVTPLHYIRQARLRKAASLIRRHQSSLGFEEIARQCGFNDSGYFSVCFRKEFGQCPRDFSKTADSEVFDSRGLRR